MKEWAEADNQAKELPKADRQALNEVRTQPHPFKGLWLHPTLSKRNLGLWTRP